MMAVDGFQWVRPSRVKNQQGGSWNAVGTKEEPESDAQPFSMESTSLRSQEPLEKRPVQIEVSEN